MERNVRNTPKITSLSPAYKGRMDESEGGKG